MFLETAGGSVFASIFKLTTIFVPRAAILVIISASSTVMQAVGIFFTPVHDKQTNKQKKVQENKANHTPQGYNQVLQQSVRHTRTSLVFKHFLSKRKKKEYSYGA